MSKLNIERKELLKMIQKKEVSPESALAILKKFDQAFVNDDVAIIGYSCRCAGSDNAEEFWQNILDGKRPFNRKYTEHGDVYTCELPEKELFDNEFFNISPKEALLMDPRQRVFLEESWKALENAGYTEERLKGTDCGVFVGVSSGDYGNVIDENGMTYSPETTTSLSPSILASRISYYLDLRGPALAIDTACSSAAVALHYAMQSLANSDCSMAVVGGVEILSTNNLLIKSSIISMTSPDGKCLAFDEGANGTVFADGVNAVVIKRLDDALKDNDNIVAIIRGSTINNNGKTNGITAPSANSQTTLIKKLYADKEIRPDSIGYIETHGTGTPLGDPIEFKALNEVYSACEKGSCVLGACKTAIGHTMTASGLFNVISVIKSFEHGLRPPIAGFNLSNPRIDLDNSAFCINTKPVAWEVGKLRRAAVSSFGFSGTNVHMILEEPKTKQRTKAQQQDYFIPISAKSEESLRSGVRALLAFCSSCNDDLLPDIEYTLIEGRNQFPVRACFVVRTISELVQKLSSAVNGSTDSDHKSLDKICNAFLNGQRIRFSDLGRSETGSIIDMPSYSFARNRFCFENKAIVEKEQIKSSNYTSNSLNGQKNTALDITEIEKLVTAAIAEKMMLDPDDIDAEAMFMDYGIDSITSVDVVNKLKKELSVELKATDFFRFGCIRNLSEYLNNSGAAIREKVIVCSCAPEDDDIAIVGISLRFAGADNIDEYWDVILNGKDNVKEIERWESESYYDPDPENKRRSYSKWCGMLDNIFEFDSKFFGILPREAELMDPEHRIFLEEAYHAFEDAGYTREMLSKKKCGVYIGNAGSCYDSNIKQADRYNDAYAFIGNIPSVLPARISYFFNLRGPSVAVDTACSASMVAIHLAYQAIKSGDVEFALAGGITLLSNPDFHTITSRGNMLSPTGKCWVFDERADGFVPSEGIGLVVLKKLSDAKRDGDNIYGVIKGSGMNQDGKSNGITSPNVDSQSDLESEVYKRFNIDVDKIGYVEAHGTGTKLGDPIEIEALTTSFGQFTSKKQYCALGSVKSNIGHAMAAAGSAGIIKSLLVMKNKIIPPVCNFRKQNSYIDLTNSAFYIPTEAKEWKAEEGSRMTAVSSFGISGTNVHMVLGEYVSNQEKNTVDSELLFVFSNGNEKKLKEYLQSFSKWLSVHRDIDLYDLAYTLSARRNHHSNRIAVSAKTVDELINKLETITNGENVSGVIAVNNLCSEKIKNTAEVFVNKKGSDIGALYPEGRNISIPAYLFNRKYFCVTPKTENTSEYILTKIDWRKVEKVGSPMCHSQEIILLYSDAQEELANTIFKNIDDCLVLRMNINNINESNNEEVFRLLKDDVNTVIDISDVGINSSQYPRLQFLRSLIIYKNRRNIRYMHVTLGGVPFMSGGICSVNGAVMASYGKMLKDEYSGLQTVTVDFTSKDSIISGISELLASEWDYGQLCVRNGSVYEPVEVRINETASVSDRISDGKNGTVIITGAFGGIGRSLIEQLVELGYRSFALLSRNPVTDRSTDRGKILDLLDSKGASYLLYSGSLTDKEKLAEFVENVKRKLGDITGAIHLAGNCDDNDVHPFYKKNISNMYTVFEPKCDGTEVVFELIDSIKLKYFIMFSSLTTIYSSLATGISTYAAANEYLNRFALAKASCGDNRVTAICWSDWNVNGIRDSSSAKYINMGFKDLDTKKSFELLRKASSLDGEPLVIATRRSSFNETSVSYRAVNNIVTVEADSNTEVTSSKLAESVTVKENEIQPVRADDIISGIIEVFSQETKIDTAELDVQAAFIDLGIDSIILGEIVKALEKKFEISMDPNAMFENTNIDQLAEYLAGIVKIVPIKNESSQLTLADYKSVVAEILSYELRIPIDEIEADESFNEMGVDSIVLGEIVKHMERRFGTKIDPNILLEYPTLNEVSECLCSQRIVIPEINNNAEKTVKQENIIQDHTIGSAEKKENDYSGKIAVIGIACHFPGAENKEKFWKNLTNGIDSVTEVPSDRWDINEFYSPEGGSDKTNSKWGGFLNDIESFDPEYFGFKKEDGIKFDPTIRQFLEVAAETFNDAGYSKKDIWGKNVAVFAGARTGDYAKMTGTFEKNTIIGTAQNFVASHVSHVYNLSGPSMTVDSACSSSLSAVHLAYRSLINGDCEYALAGGVEILLNEIPYLMIGASGAFSPDGKCKTFDVNANGFVPGEGCGAVLLRRYEDAVRDNNEIYAVLNSSAINNDGNTMGVTTPNPEAQKDVISKAIENSGVSPENISYIETHGTGTLIGDPIELKSLTRVFRQYTDKKHFCAVGSVKTNIGHLLSAAGIASFIKCCLIVRNRFIPRTLNCVNVNPRFNFDESPFYPVVDNISLNEKNMVVGVSSFGFGGTNVHQIISSCDMSSVPVEKTKIIYNKERYWNNDYKKQQNAVKSATVKAAEKKLFSIVAEKKTVEKKLFDINIL